jgi:OOP family OmpA-OmpF porin
MTITCTRCGASLEEHNAFCTKCGARRGESTGAAPTQRFCTKCGAALEAGIRFCTKCGSPVDATPTVTAAANAGREESAQASQPAAPVSRVPAPAPSPVPAAKSGGPILKFVAVVVVLAVLVGVAGVGAFVYIASRAKKKVAEIERTYKTAPMTSAAAGARAVTAASSGAANAAKAPAANANAPAAPLPIPAPGPTPVPVAATGDKAKDWALEYERTPNSPEADLVVRAGDINNLGFGWPPGFDPFSGNSTPPHPWPTNPPAGSAEGTDRIMLGSAVLPTDPEQYSRLPRDGYSDVIGNCPTYPPNAPPCKYRLASLPRPITLVVGTLPPKIDAVLFQIFVDDFQAPVFHSHFQVSLNGTRIPSFEDAVNALDQTGPIGKLITLRLLPEYWPLLQSGTVRLLIDDPTTHVRDGYAIDFVRILVNPHNFKYQVSLAASVVDAEKHTPIPGATVTASLESATTDRQGHCKLDGLPAGLVVATAIAPGYDESSVPVDLVAGQKGKAEFQLHRHDEGTAALARSIAETGSARVYGIHFDTDSSKLRPDSLPALDAVLGLINSQPGSRWIIEGHTDNQGSADHNQKLSEERADSVVSWLKVHGVSVDRLVPQGFGASRPVADNATANGRALNRRVEIAPAAKP